MLKMLPAAMYMKYKTNDKKKYTNKIKWPFFQEMTEVCFQQDL